MDLAFDCLGVTRGALEFGGAFRFPFRLGGVLIFSFPFGVKRAAAAANTAAPAALTGTEDTFEGNEGTPTLASPKEEAAERRSAARSWETGSQDTGAGGLETESAVTFFIT
jgi:hypothetical protein